MQVTIDPGSGFCFGVRQAIRAAESELNEKGRLYCLGDIVHNEREVDRLTSLGLIRINHREFLDLHDCTVLIRAHGEPPETYRIANRNNIVLLDATCPIVKKLQQRVEASHAKMAVIGGQTAVYGNEGHAEVNGLVGQTNGNAVVIGDEDDLGKLDLTRPVRLFSQTTKSIEGFERIREKISAGMKAASGGAPIDFEWKDTICRQVSNRSEQLKEYAANHDVIIFVSGRQSSNGRILFKTCRDVNPRSYLVGKPDDVDRSWFGESDTVGICGATSTPLWQMEEIAGLIEKNGL